MDRNRSTDNKKFDIRTSLRDLGSRYAEEHETFLYKFEASILTFIATIVYSLSQQEIHEQVQRGKQMVGYYRIWPVD